VAIRHRTKYEIAKRYLPDWKLFALPAERYSTCRLLNLLMTKIGIQNDEN
jgi:hypothetical protein